MPRVDRRVTRTVATWLYGAVTAVCIFSGPRCPETRHKHARVSRTPDRTWPVQSGQLLLSSLDGLWPWGAGGHGPQVARPNSSAEAREPDLAVRAPGFQILAVSYAFVENTEPSRPTEKQAAQARGRQPPASDLGFRGAEVWIFPETAGSDFFVLTQPGFTAHLLCARRCSKPCDRSGSDRRRSLGADVLWGPFALPRAAGSLQP